MLSQGVQGVIIDGPTNQAIIAGSPGHMYCSSNLIRAALMHWQFTPLGGAPIMIARNCAQPVGPYDVRENNVTTCVLSMLPVTADMAGLYTCIPDAEKPVSAQLIVLGMRHIYIIIYSN